MGVTRTESHEDGAREPHQSFGAQPAPSLDEAPTAPLLLGSIGERCVNCGASLASDQRYCVQCGERRGTSRFAIMTGAAGPPPASPSAPAAAGSGRRRRAPYGATLIAGIATLLVAMGVGVEIGHINNSGATTTRAATPPVTVINGGGAPSAGTTTAAASAPTTPGHATKTDAKKAKKPAAAPKPTKAAVQKASHAASSVLGSGGGQSNATVTTGQSCKAGSAGCSNGHFDGSFFGQ